MNDSLAKGPTIRTLQLLSERIQAKQVTDRLHNQKALEFEMWFEKKNWYDSFIYFKKKVS